MMYSIGARSFFLIREWLRLSCFFVIHTSDSGDDDDGVNVVQPSCCIECSFIIIKIMNEIAHRVTYIHCECALFFVLAFNWSSGHKTSPNSSVDIISIIFLCILNYIMNTCWDLFMLLQFYPCDNYTAVVVPGHSFFIIGNDHFGVNYKIHSRELYNIMLK